MNRFSIGWNRLVFWIGLALALSMAFQGASAETQVSSSHQVTLFGIRAIPGDSTSDPELSKVLPQLRKLLPDHGFKLLGTTNERRSFGQEVACDLGQGLWLRAELIELERGGKIRLDVALDDHDQEQFVIAIATPPNQLVFLDKKLKDGNLLLIGVGAR
ncbi:hypothetical protein BH23PLA1_BH23PLA1_08760 [soil metagenome]